MASNQAVKVERKRSYQGVQMWGITGAAEITPSKATAEKWARLENAASSSVPKPLVHWVKSWSGVRADETALCGSEDYRRTLANVYHDVAGQPMNICPACERVWHGEDEMEYERRQRG